MPCAWASACCIDGLAAQAAGISVGRTPANANVFSRCAAEMAGACSASAPSRAQSAALVHANSFGFSRSACVMRSSSLKQGGCRRGALDACRSAPLPAQRRTFPFTISSDLPRAKSTSASAPSSNREATGWMVGAPFFCHSPQLTAVLRQQRQDQVGLLALRFAGR